MIGYIEILIQLHLLTKGCRNKQRHSLVEVSEMRTLHKLHLVSLDLCVWDRYHTNTVARKQHGRTGALGSICSPAFLPVLKDHGYLIFASRLKRKDHREDFRVGSNGRSETVGD